MTRDVEWSDEAADDFNQAIDYIARESDANARLVASRILSAIDLLAEFPTGHQGRVAGTYEKLVQKTPYIVAYKMTNRVIFVARIIHGARDWPAGEWPAE